MNAISYDNILNETIIWDNVVQYETSFPFSQIVPIVLLWKYKLYASATGILDGLLFSSVLARPAIVFSRPHQVAVAFHQDAGTHLAAGHLLLQRQKLLRAHHHRAQQTAPH